MASSSSLVEYILKHCPTFRRARLPSLYSDFRPLLLTNRDGYTANIAAWLSALSVLSRAGRIPSPNGGHDLLTLRTGEELVRELDTKEWGRPLALGTVIDEAMKNGDAVPLESFKAGVRARGYATGSWIGTPWQVMTWGMRQLGLGGGAVGEDRLAVGTWVLTGNVDECARNVLKVVADRERVDRIFSREMFQTEFAKSLNDECALTNSDFEVLITYLARDKKVVAYDGQTIKFKSPGDKTVSIAVQDTTIASLKTLIVEHNSQISSLTTRIDQLSHTARTTLAKKNRVAALAALRSKKLAESALNSRADTLAQLESVFDKIRQAADQVEIVRVMEASTGVLQALQKEVGGLDRVEDVVDSLREEVSKVDEVGDAINGLSQTTAVVDENELDDELEALEREQHSIAERDNEAGTARKLAQLEGEKTASPVVSSDQSPQEAVHKEVEGDVAEGLGRMSLEEGHPTSAQERKEEKGRAWEPSQTGAVPST